MLEKCIRMFGIKSLTLPNPAQVLNLPKNTKLTVLGVSATFALIGFLTALFRWKKRKRGPIDRRRRFLEIQRERERTGPLSHNPNGGTNMILSLITGYENGICPFLNCDKVISR